MTPGSYSPTYAGGPSDMFVMQLEMLPTGVDRYGHSSPGCLGPVSMGAIHAPFAGAPDFAVYASATPPGGQGVLLLGVAGLTHPVVLGESQLWVDLSALTLLLPARADAHGYVETALPVPAALVGLTLHAQYVFLTDASCPGPTRLPTSNALAITVQPASP